EKVHAQETNRRELKEIPLDAIVGSVGRYKDFTRRFFPLIEEDEYRWARVHTLTESMEGLPPIEVFQIGDVYFVRDGNHRVSVARDMGATLIEAYVTYVESSVSLDPSIQADDLIIKERYARFLERTRLDKAFPDLDLSMSVAGNYRVLEQQIAVHQHWVKEKKGLEISFPEAAERWYRYIYWPVIQIIRERGMMRDFPNRTETDLFVWIDKHRHDLADRLGWTVDAEQAIVDLANQQQGTPMQAMQQFGQKLREAVIPAALEGGPSPGEWRELWATSHREDQLFTHILVAIDGQEAGWNALQQAMAIAKREKGKVFGLHVISEDEEDPGLDHDAIGKEFERRCSEEGVAAEFTTTTGQPTATINYRARWADLVVVSLSHPPGPKPVDRLSSHFAQLLRNCPTPVLAVPRIAAGLDRLLLAYDGSPKANEALYVAHYMVEQWGADLTVVSVKDKNVRGKKSITKARSYLEENQVKATYVREKGRPAKVILKIAHDISCDLIIMGGYGGSSLSEIVAGSVVDQVLRTRNRPILICR
ncbi:MAG: universal stress protein, partial [Candidatus Promineifilaceae bacterium]|nr:universal stress protein [Candidatus Promineifilaceae bacterium]